MEIERNPRVSTFRGPKHYRGNNNKIMKSTNKIKYGIAYL